jgi:hypothetical protein
MKSESIALTLLSVFCRKIAESTSTDASTATKASGLFREWELLVVRTQHPLRQDERRRIDEDAESLFKRMKEFVTLQVSRLSL